MAAEPNFLTKEDIRMLLLRALRDAEVRFTKRQERDGKTLAAESQSILLQAKTTKAFLEEYGAAARVAFDQLGELDPDTDSTMWVYATNQMNIQFAAIASQEMQRLRTRIKERQRNENPLGFIHALTDLHNGTQDLTI